MLDLHQLACFAAAYRHRSISRAAESIFISQQAVSHNIRQLEKELGGALFSRSSSGIAPTELGEALIGDALALLEAASLMEEKAAALCRRQTGFTLAYADGVFSVEDAADLSSLTRYGREELGVPLRFEEHTTGECLSMLASGEADILCIFNPEPDDALWIEPLASYPLYVGMAPGHPLAQQEVVTLEDLTRYPLIIDQRDDALNDMMARFSSGPMLAARRYAPSTQLSSFAAIMRRDNSLLMFTEPFVRAYAGADAIVIPFDGDGEVLHLCAVYRRKHPGHAALGKIAAWLRAQYTSS